jgi:hypothetical protein
MAASGEIQYTDFMGMKSGYLSHCRTAAWRFSESGTYQLLTKSIGLRDNTCCCSSSGLYKRVPCISRKSVKCTKLNDATDRCWTKEVTSLPSQICRTGSVNLQETVVSSYHNPWWQNIIRISRLKAGKLWTSFLFHLQDVEFNRNLWLNR